jgi:hypothetical protein
LEKYFLGTQKNFWSDTFPTPDPSLISYPILPPFYRDFLLYFMPVPQISPGSCQLWDTKGRTISVFAISTREGTSLRNLHRNCPSLPSPANVLYLTVIVLFILWIKCYICKFFSLGHPLWVYTIVNIYDMVWKPFVLGDCVPCAGSRLKNPLSFYCLTIVSSASLAKGMVPSICFAYQGYILRHILQITKYYHHFSMENVCVTSFGQFSLIKTNMCRVKQTV